MSRSLRPEMIALGAPVTTTTRNTSISHSLNGEDNSSENADTFRSPFESFEQLPSHALAGPSISGITLTSDGLGDLRDDRNHALAAPITGYNAKRSIAAGIYHLTDMAEANRVSVSRGKTEFAELERRFSNLSHNSRRSEKSGFVNKPEQDLSSSSGHTPPDPEKGKTEDEEAFDLSEVLRSGRKKRDEAGIQHKAVGVVWEDLEVIGAGGMKINIRNFSSAIMEQFLTPIISLLGLVGYKPFDSKPRTILHKNSGVLKPGEMCLVLGRPGSGCSTFLRSVANQRDGFLSVNGNVEYAGVGWGEMAKTFSG